jgi:hypothetical protein
MSQQKGQQPTTMETKLQQLKDKLPEGKMKESVNEKLKYVNKPIQK